MEGDMREVLEDSSQSNGVFLRKVLHRARDIPSMSDDAVWRLLRISDSILDSYEEQEF